MHAKAILLTYIILFQLTNVFAQMNCDEVTLLRPSSATVDFTFDTFQKYISGITIAGATVLKVKVVNSALNDPLGQCRWKLQVVVHKMGGTTAADEWEDVQMYGSAGTYAKIDILHVSARNGCSTPVNSNNFDNFTVDGDIISFIDSPGITNPNGACAQNVNGPGSYTSSFNEYTFNIDYRVTPGFNFRPGIYQLYLAYQLIEDN